LVGAEDRHVRGAGHVGPDRGWEDAA
jgi:hypothetical protein